MRGHRRNDKAARFGKDYRSPTAKRIARGPGWRGDDKAVRPIRIQELPIQIRMDLDHGGCVCFMDGEFVQSIRYISKQWFIGVKMYQASLIHDKGSIGQCRDS